MLQHRQYEKNKDLLNIRDIKYKPENYHKASLIMCNVQFCTVYFCNYWVILQSLYMFTYFILLPKHVLTILIDLINVYFVYLTNCISPFLSALPPLPQQCTCTPFGTNKGFLVLILMGNLKYNEGSQLTNSNVGVEPKSNCICFITYQSSVLRVCSCHIIKNKV